MNPLFVIRYSLLERLGRIRLLSGTIILFAAAGISFGAEQTTATGANGNAGLSESQLQAMEQRIATITDPVARLFFKAGLERARGEPDQALQTLSTLIVHHAHDEKWIARSELMSAELYLEMGMLNAADVTARQVQLLYAGTDVANQADALRSKIENLKPEAAAAGAITEEQTKVLQ